jgi:hypothetical protein
MTIIGKISNTKTIHKVIISFVIVILVLVIISYFTIKFECYKKEKNNFTIMDSSCWELPKQTCTKEQDINDINLNFTRAIFNEEKIKFSDKYLYDKKSPALVIAQYDEMKGRVVKVLPREIIQKILLERLGENSTDISVFVSQSYISAANVQIPFHDATVSEYLNLYHTALLFVKPSPFQTNTSKDIIATLELWDVGSGELGPASCLYPRIRDGKVDIKSQDLNKIIMRCPEAFGCKNDGMYWNNQWVNTTYLGELSAFEVEYLYDLSVDWLENNWVYTGVSLREKVCDYSSKFVMSKKCDSFVRDMCNIIIEQYPSKREMIKTLKLNDAELIGDFEPVDLNDEKVVMDINNYVKAIDKFIGLFSRKESFELNYPVRKLSKQTMSFLHKKRNNNVQYQLSSENHNQRSSDFEYGINRLIGKELTDLIVSEFKNAFMYVAMFEQNEFTVYKILLKPPYMALLWNSCVADF